MIIGFSLVIANIMFIPFTPDALAATAPDIPTGLTVTGVTSTTVTVSWTAPTSDGGSPITGYMMEKSTVPITQMGVHEWNTNTPSVTTYTYTGLSPNTEYAFDVATVNAIGYSPPSARVTTTTSAAATAPDIPTGLTVTGVTSTTVTVSWTAPTSDGGSPITGYMIEKGEGSGPIQVVTWNTNAPSVFTYTYTGLSPNTSYTFDVATVNAIGYSPPSARVTTTTSADVTSSTNFAFDVYNETPYYTNTQTGNYLENFPTAHDGSTNVPVLCDYPNNDDFSVGTTILNCDATNSAGDTISATFTITFILHTSGPTLILPPNEEAIGNSLGIGTYTSIFPDVDSEIWSVINIECIDGTNGEPVLFFNPDGSLHSYSVSPTLGVHNITCTATDPIGNTTVDSYTITFVEDVSDGILGDVISFNSVSTVLIETINSAGQIVTFTDPVAYDSLSGTNIPSTCTPSSGTLFAIGTVTVTCTAINSAGDVGEVKFNVDVRMPDSVTLNLPVDTTIAATGTDGAIFTYDVTTISGMSGISAHHTCEPTSGSKFPIGSTIVTCDATAGGATTTDSFTVTVYDPANVSQTQSSTLISLSEQPQAVAVNSKTNTFVVATINPFIGTSNVHFIDGNSHKITNSVQISSLIEAIDVNLTTNTVYGIDDDTLYVIDGNSKTLKTQLSLTQNPHSKAEKITIDATKNLIFVSGSGLKNGSTANFATVAVNGNTNQIIIGDESNAVGHEIHFESSTNKIYTRTNNIATYHDGTTYRWEHTNIVIPQDNILPGENNAYELAYMPSTNKFYTNSYNNDVISIIDFNSKKAETISITKPIDLDTNSKTNQLYVVNDVSPGTVTILDSNNQILKTVTVGSKPTEIAVNDVTDVAYVLNQGDSTISIIGDTVSTLSSQIVNEPEAKPRPPVPEWLKNNVQWWADGAIDDNSFKQGVSYMIKENIISIKDLPQSSSISETKIPEWIKTNAKWWADGAIDESEFISGLKYMVEKGIIGVN